MNKLLLTLGAAFLMTVSAFAQTNSEDSGNMPNENYDGYTFEFNGNAVQNCTSQIKNEGSVKPSWDAQSTSIDTSAFLVSGELSMTVDTTNGWRTEDAFVLIPYEGNCSSAYLDLSVNSNVNFTVNSTSDVSYFYVAFCDGTDKCADAAIFVTELTQGDNQIEIDGSTTVWETWDGNKVDSSSVLYLLVGFRDGGYGTAPTEGTYKIDQIQIGENSVVGLNSAANTVSLSAYPNPAVDYINFEEELKDVVIYNTLGLPVYQAAASTGFNVEAFESGVYVAQHSKGTTRFTVK